MGDLGDLLSFRGLLSAALSLSLSVSVAASGTEAPDERLARCEDELSQTTLPREGMPRGSVHTDLGTDPETLLKAYFLVLATKSPALLAPSVQAELLSIVGEGRSTALIEPGVVLRLLVHFQAQLGDDYHRVVGELALVAKQAVQQYYQPQTPRRPDEANVNRGWGYMVLDENDPIFNEPEYLADLLAVSGTSGEIMDGGEGPKIAETKFIEEWQKIAPSNVDPLWYTLTGSDANNSMYDVAFVYARERNPRAKDGEILYMDGVFAGGRGRVARGGFLGDKTQRLKEFMITNPVSKEREPTGAELARIEALEEQALAEIEKKVTARGARPIGAILLEPVLGANGVKFYRTSFLLKLRALCDRLGIAIIADEVLTGGGRTGKFFAYQHYEGFEPDFVTFGKAIQIAGVAQVHRNGVTPRWVKQQVTLRAYAEPLLKAAQTLKRIRRDRLMENATEMGKYIVGSLQDYFRFRPGNRAPEIRGIGLLIYCNRELPKEIFMAIDRVLPKMTITQPQWDRLLSGP